MTTKLHLAVEQGQKPMSIVITAGQRGDSPQLFEAVLERSASPVPVRAGRARVRTGSAPIRRTPPARTVPIYAGAVFAA